MYDLCQFWKFSWRRYRISNCGRINYRTIGAHFWVYADVGGRKELSSDSSTNPYSGIYSRSNMRTADGREIFPNLKIFLEFSFKYKEKMLLKDKKNTREFY